MGDTVKQFTMGQVLLLSSGEYSAYGVYCTLRVLRDFTSDDVEALARQAAVVTEQWQGVDIALVLVAAGFAEEIESRELHDDDWHADSHHWDWKPDSREAK